MKEIHTFDNRKNKTKCLPNRFASRAVIFKNDMILLLYLTKTNEYKFPGGGVEDNESFEDALIRETNEEAGVQIKEVLSCLGYIDQIYPDIYVQSTTFYMRSIYYLCNIYDEFKAQKLSGYELKLGLKPIWVKLDDAIKINELRIKNGTDYHWTSRELYMLKHLRDLKEKI